MNDRQLQEEQQQEEEEEVELPEMSGAVDMVVFGQDGQIIEVPLAKNKKSSSSLGSQEWEDMERDAEAWCNEHRDVINEATGNTVAHATDERQQGGV